MAHYFNDYVLPTALQAAWDDLTIEQREKYLLRALGDAFLVNKKTLRRWAEESGRAPVARKAPARSQVKKS